MALVCLGMGRARMVNKSRTNHCENNTAKGAKISCPNQKGANKKRNQLIEVQSTIAFTQK